MLREYALDPNVLTNWKDFRYFIEKFGISEGRLISKYPKKWKYFVYLSLAKNAKYPKSAEIEINLKEEIDKIDPNIIAPARKNYFWDHKTSWLISAVEEHKRKAFHAIISNERHEECSELLVADFLNEKHKLWKSQRELCIPRDKKELAKALSLFLQVSQDIVFIDQYFRPGKDEFISTFKYYLKNLFVFEYKRTRINVKIFTSYINEIDHKWFYKACDEHFSYIIPKGLSMKICRVIFSGEDVESDDMHNRYILSERGGVRFAWGLDSGKPNKNDDISFLDEDVYQKRWSQYCGKRLGYDIFDEHVISGKKI